jgi:hypothetical protein
VSGVPSPFSPFSPFSSQFFPVPGFSCRRLRPLFCLLVVSDCRGSVPVFLLVVSDCQGSVPVFRPSPFSVPVFPPFSEIKA